MENFYTVQRIEEPLSRVLLTSMKKKDLQHIGLVKLDGEGDSSNLLLNSIELAHTPNNKN